MLYVHIKDPECNIQYIRTQLHSLQIVRLQLVWLCTTLDHELKPHCVCIMYNYVFTIVLYHKQIFSLTLKINKSTCCFPRVFPDIRHIFALFPLLTLRSNSLILLHIMLPDLAKADARNFQLCLYFPILKFLRVQQRHIQLQSCPVPKHSAHSILGIPIQKNTIKHPV